LLVIIKSNTKHMPNIRIYRNTKKFFYKNNSIDTLRTPMLSSIIKQ